MLKPQSRVTIDDIAKAANVSKMSVSRALNGQPGLSEETRQRILQKVEEMGYVANPIARNLRGGTTNMIGLVVPGLVEPYMGEVLRGISRAAEKYHYGLLLYTQADSSDQQRDNYYSSILTSGLVDGVVIIVPRSYQRLVDTFRQRGLPYVLIDHHGIFDDELTVMSTNRKGIVDAVRHVAALGHRRIGFITGRVDIAVAQERLQGYYDALSELHLPHDPDLVKEGDFLQASGFTSTKALLAMKNPPTAIICSNDMMALGAMDAIRAAGLTVGKDISLVGFDDLPLASYVYPMLTTIRQPLAQMGEAAIESLVEVLQGHHPTAVYLELPTELVVRDSTAPVPKR